MRAAVLLAAVVGCLGDPLPAPPSLDGMMTTLRAFEIAAQAHGNSRSIESGYNASADYVISQLSQMEDKVSVVLQHFEVPVFNELAEPTLAILTASPEIPLKRCIVTTGALHYEGGCDYANVRYGGNTDQPVDITAETIFVENPCSDAGFSGFEPGKGAVFEQTNACLLLDMVTNAQKAQAAFVLVSSRSPGSIPGGRVYDSATWREGDVLPTITTLGVTAALAGVLRQAPDTRVRVTAHNKINIAPTYNIIATTVAGNPSDIIMIGSHLDSVPAGPGINDNGSGSSLVLQIALQLLAAGTMDPQGPKFRFAWWGAEEIGLMGSRYYVDDLVHHYPEELKTLRCYLNFDMEAGPNFVRLIYDGSTAPEEARQGSIELQKVFEQGWDQDGLKYKYTPMTGGSDFLPFILAGVPSSGLASGAGGLKSEQERLDFGGVANAALDPCYHNTCDTVANINQKCLTDCGSVLTYVLNTISAAPVAPRIHAPINATSHEHLIASYHKNLAKHAAGFGFSCNGLPDDMIRGRGTVRRERDRA